MKPSITCSAISASAGVDMLGRVVADAALAADEQHRGRAERGHHHRIMPGAAGEPAQRLARGGHARRRAGPSARDRTGWRADRGSASTIEIRRRALAAIVGDSREDRLGRGIAHAPDRPSGCRCVKSHIAGNDIGRAGRRLEPPHRRDQIGRRRRARCVRPPAPSRPPPRARRGAAASRWCRRGPAIPSTVDLVAQLRGDAGDGADREALGLQHRPLLDMGFEIARCSRSAPHRRAACGRSDPARHPASIASGACVDRHRRSASPTTPRPAPDRSVPATARLVSIGGGKARAFLVAERDHLDREGQPPPGRLRAPRRIRSRASRRAARHSARRRARCRDGCRSAAPAPARRRPS